MKKISVIVPCYNVESYIDRCVASLVNQTLGMDDMELIFVDDASTDHTRDKLAVWEKRYPDSIMVIHCGENRKQGTARNIGMQYASGEYIGFVDSDDYVSLEMYQVLYEKAATYRCDLVGCLSVREEQNGIVAMDAEPFQQGDRYLQIQSVSERKQLMRRGLPGGVWCKIYSHALLAESELYFPEQIRYEDNYWGAFLLQEISDYYIVNQPLYHYIVNEQSTIMRQDAMHHLDRLVIELMKVEEYQRRGLFERYHDEIEFDFLQMYFINTIRILFVRFREIPYDIIYTMQDNVRDLFPNYWDNPYLDELPQLQRELLKMIDVSLDREKIDVLANAYRKVLTEYM